MQFLVWLLKRRRKAAEDVNGEEQGEFILLEDFEGDWSQE